MVFTYATIVTTSIAATATSAGGTMVQITNITTDGDPYLEALPSFSYSMPVQLVMLGVTITLLAILGSHLLFTVRYHLPLSKQNYLCQVSAVFLSVLLNCVQLGVVSRQIIKRSRAWPFMFDYIEEPMPPTDWSLGEVTGLLLLRAAGSLATHATHIQFLTLLFPSSLEKKLIVGLLGPLALVSGGLQLTQISESDIIIDLGDAIRNTCNSALTLLYTLALFIWGLTLNRSRAWTTEGGTAAFGVLALGLGALGTAVNFFEVKEDRLRWLAGVVTCILLWQSWAGFWWWVGAGMWAGEAEDVERREAKKRRRAESKLAKKQAKDQPAAAQSPNSSRSLTSIRRRLGRTTSQRSVEGEEVELQEMNAPPAPRPRRGAGSTSNESTSTGSSPPPSSHFYDPIIQLFAPFFLRLRDAHEEAAVAKAAEPPGLSEQERRKWGLRALMLKGKHERGERRRAARGEVSDAGEADDRRAGFELDGQRLADDGSDTSAAEGAEDDEEELAEAAYPPRAAAAAQPNRAQDGAREDAAGEGWAWFGFLRRARLKAVDRY